MYESDAEIATVENSAVPIEAPTWRAVLVSAEPAPARTLKIGRSGEIRTLDPQHPMLMRYQAALRSDRGISSEAADHTCRADPAQRVSFSGG